MHFTGEIKRCEIDKNKYPVRYGIATCFLEVGEEKKKAFLETINFFLKKQDSH